MRPNPSYALMCDQMESVGLNHQWIDTMDAATGWSAGSHSTAYGFGALHISATDTGATPLKIYDADFTKRRYTHVRMWIDDVSKLATLTIRFYDSDGVQITSQDILTGAGRVAVTGWNDLVMLQAQPGPSDCRRIRFNVTATSGQTANVYIGAIQTCDLRPLCTIWTDDGDPSVLSDAEPLLTERGMVGVVSVVSDTSIAETALTEAELQALDAAGWDICNHTKTHANLANLSESEIETEVSTCRDYLTDTVGIGPAGYHFVHPMSSQDALSLSVVKQYATLNRSYSGDNWRIPVDWHAIGSDDITSTDTVASVKSLIDDAISEQRWLVLLYHRFTSGTPTGNQVANDDFEEVLDYLVTKSSEIDVVTPTGAIAAMAPNYALEGDDTVAVLDRATAYWKGVDYSGSGDWLDGSGNGHDATPRNSPTFADGVWTLNGSTQDFQISHHADLNIGSGSFTLVIRGKTDTRDYHAPFSKRSNGATGSAGYVCYSAPDKMRVEVSDGSVEDGENHSADWDVDSTPFTTTSTWAFARDGGTEYKVARDGTYAAGTADGAADADNALAAYIGSLGGGAYFYDGEIEAVALFVGEVLSESDLGDLATELVTAASTGGGTPSGVSGNIGINTAVRIGI